VVPQVPHAAFTSMRCIGHHDISDAGCGAHHIVAPTCIDADGPEGNKVISTWEVGAMQETVAGRSDVRLAQIAGDAGSGAKGNDRMYWMLR